MLQVAVNPKGHNDVQTSFLNRASDSCFGVHFVTVILILLF